MTISDVNNEIIDSLKVDAFINAPAKYVTQWKSQIDSEQWWKIGNDIVSSSLVFRIVRIFSRFKNFFPSQLRNWYENQVMTTLDTYVNRLKEQLPEGARNNDPRVNRLFHVEWVRDENEQIMGIQINLTTYNEEAFEQPKHEVEFENPKKYQPEPKEDRETFKNFFSHLKTRYEEILDESSCRAIEKHEATLKYHPGTLPMDYVASLVHVQDVVETISEEDSNEAIAIVLKSLSKMTALGIREETLKDHIELRSYNDSKCVEKKINENTTLFLMKNDQDQIKARKIMNTTSIRGSLVCRILAYDIDAILGYDGIPAGSYVSDKKSYYQKYIPDALDLDTFIEKNGQEGMKIIRNIDTAVMQMHQLFGLIQGRGDGHGKNTIIQTQDGLSPKLFDIDEEDNFIERNMSVNKDNADEGKFVCNIVSMGFPQGNRPISKLLLKLFAWEGFKSRAQNLYDRFSNRFKNLLPKRRDAFVERLEKIQELCRFESTKETPTLTPRDCYFMISGKDYYYEECMKNNISVLDFFRGYVKEYDDCFSTRLEELEIPEVSPDTFHSGVGEQYPGDHALRKVFKQLHKGREATFAIRDGSFDKEGWLTYKKHCANAERPVKNFMLSHFLKGFDKRMSRQFAYRFPSYHLEVIQKSNQAYELVISKPGDEI